MNQYHRIMHNLSVAVFLLPVATTSHAAQITLTNVYSNSITATGVVGGAMPATIFTPAITPFNPTLGTLTDVDIRIYGNVNYSGTAGSSYTVGPFGEIIPLSYQLDTTFGLDIDGLGGDYFSLGNAMQIQQQFVALGFPGGSPIIGATSFSFSFDYLDLAGQFVGPSDISCSTCTGITPPASMSGGLDGFIDDGTLTNMMQFNYNLSFQGLGQGGLVSLTTLSANSDVYIDTTYTYTEPQPVPEPPTLLLLLTGLIFMFRRRISTDK